jgi:hypothetical protein
MGQKFTQKQIFVLLPAFSYREKGASCTKVTTHACKSVCKCSFLGFVAADIAQYTIGVITFSCCPPAARPSGRNRGAIFKSCAKSVSAARPFLCQFCRIFATLLPKYVSGHVLLCHDWGVKISHCTKNMILLLLLLLDLTYFVRASNSGQAAAAHDDRPTEGPRRDVVRQNEGRKTDRPYNRPRAG